MKIVTLTLAPAFDIHCHATSISVGHENLASITDYSAGGKGVNISRALRSFCFDSLALIVIGEENGADFQKMLENENISFQKVDIKGRIRENITLHTDDGKETRISFTSSGAPSDVLSCVESMTEDICDKDTVLTFTGRLPEGVSVDAAKEYIKAQNARGIRVVLDSRSFSLADILDVKPFLIKPNEEEISAYMGYEIEDFISAGKAAAELCEKGIENVMISLGDKGALLCSGNTVYTVEAPKIEAVSTIGAGDSMIAGFLYALAKDKSAEECLKTAVAFGSAACLRAGTNPPLREDAEKFLKEIIANKYNI